MKKKLIVTAAIVVVVLAAILGMKETVFKAPPPSYLTVPVVRGSIENAVLATGVLEPYEQVNVGAQVSGQLKSLKVKLGDTVKKGQLLAQIDPRIPENNLKNAQAQLENVKAQIRGQQALLTEYTLALKRQQTMFASNASSKADLESAQAQLASTQAQIAALNAQLKQAEIGVDTAKTNLGYTQISAPMDGVVVKIVTKEGQTVVSAQSAPTILILANTNTMTVKAQISEADVVKIKPGLPVYFTILGKPNKKFEASLRSIEPAPDTLTTDDQSVSTISSTAIYYNGVFDVPNPDHLLRTWMTAQVSIVLGKADDALKIPVTALGKRLGKDKYEVQVLVKGKPQTREITTALNNRVDVEVLDGLKEGDQVVVGAGGDETKPQNAPRARPMRV